MVHRHGTSRSRCVRCVAASDSPNSIKDARKRFEKERTVTIKDNFNKVLGIANVEVKEVGGFLKELDQLHKDILGSWGDKKSASVVANEEDARDDNIFADK